MADPAAVQQVVERASDPATTAALVAIAIGALKIAEKVIEWAHKKVKGDNSQTLIVQLDPEMTNAIHKTDDNVSQVKAVVTRMDADGVPLIYADRKVERNTEKIAELLKQVSDVQARIADSMNRLDDRFSEHDRTDAITFARLVDSQQRLESIAAANKEALNELKRDNAATLMWIERLANNKKE